MTPKIYVILLLKYSVDEIISICKRFPMMSKYQLVIVKEAQDLASKIDTLIDYLLNPMLSTVLVINFKYKTLDKRKKIYKAVQKFGLIFDSKKLYENQISNWISDQLKSTVHHFYQIRLYQIF